MSELSSQANLVCAFDLTGTKATGADIHRLGCTADDSLDSSDVGLEGSVFLAVRVRNRAAERNALTAYTALCHVTDTSCDFCISSNSLRTVEDSYPFMTH